MNELQLMMVPYDNFTYRLLETDRDFITQLSPTLKCCHNCVDISLLTVDCCCKCVVTQLSVHTVHIQTAD